MKTMHVGGPTVGNVAALLTSFSLSGNMFLSYTADKGVIDNPQELMDYLISLIHEISVED